MGRAGSYVSIKPEGYRYLDRISGRREESNIPINNSNNVNFIGHDNYGVQSLNTTDDAQLLTVLGDARKD